MEILTNPRALSVREAIDTIAELRNRTGKNIYFKANRGTIKVMCE